MAAAPEPEVVPEIPLTPGAAQLYVVPAGTVPLVPLTGVTENEEPLHTVVDIFEITGVVQQAVVVADSEVTDEFPHAL
ncbi:hypothetical protein DSECCO2_632650 [anaerobic digester metagenome]